MSRPLVLLVEDDSDTAALYSTLLNAEGLEVVCCPTCSHAQKWWANATRKPHLLVVDVGLPDGNGLDLCGELRDNNNGWPLPPMLVLSAHGDPRMAARCNAAGAHGFLDKLADMDRFVDMVKELIAT